MTSTYIYFPQATLVLLSPTHTSYIDMPLLNPFYRHYIKYTPIYPHSYTILLNPYPLTLFIHEILNPLNSSSFYILTGASVRYSLSPPSPLFRIDAHTGVISLSAALDYERQQMVSFDNK